nr:M20/M25/M40 family metallo-hydrolase [Budvicia aquatica]
MNNISYKSPVVMNEALRQLIIHSCEKLNLSYRHMNSGAGHDAMIMAGVCPSAMLFVPCYKGITHHPDENVTWENMAKGTEVLFHTMIALDQS